MFGSCFVEDAQFMKDERFQGDPLPLSIHGIGPQSRREARDAWIEPIETAHCLHGYGNTRIVGPLAVGPDPAMRNPLSLSGEKKTCLGLQDGDEIPCRDVPFILGAFRGGQFAFVTFSSQFVNASLCFGVSLQLRQLPCCFDIQAAAHRVQKTFQRGG